MPMPFDTTTGLLAAVREGDQEALGQLFPHVYDQLRQIAHRELARRGGTTLRTTGLVHEAYLRLVDQRSVNAEDRAHFLGIAATAMRHLVIDYVRRGQTAKRGGGWSRRTLVDEVTASPQRAAHLLDLDEALTRLTRFDPRLSAVVECRYFAGLSVGETAAALGIAPRSVDRAWQKARAWLTRELDEA